MDSEGGISVVEEEVPEVGSHDVLVEVRASLISPGTETSHITQLREDPEPSNGMDDRGYQNAGEVVAVGDAVERIAPGDRVACLGSHYAVHADYVTIPVNLCTALPDSVSYAEGSFNHLAATAMHAVRRGEVRLDENVVVMGLGIVGQLTGQLAGRSGAHVLGSDLIESRVEVARRVGFDRAVYTEEEYLVAVADDFSRGYGIDCGFICFGGDASPAFGRLLGMLAQSPDEFNRGRVVIIGGVDFSHFFSSTTGNIDIRNVSVTGPGYKDEAYERGERYPPSLVGWDTRRNLDAVIRLIEEGDLEVEPLITDRFPLEEAPAAYDKLIDHPDESLGVVLEP
jgi:threonine dehydrogenase-like Zn-dependent dehydrogenase